MSEVDALVRDDGVRQQLLAAMTEQQQRLERLIALVDQHAAELRTIEHAVADRVKNMLMSVQTASDILKKQTLTRDVAVQLSDQLSSTVAATRAAIDRICHDLARLRQS